MKNMLVLDHHISSSFILLLDPSGKLADKRLFKFLPLICLMLLACLQNLLKIGGEENRFSYLIVLFYNICKNRKSISFKFISWS